MRGEDTRVLCTSEYSDISPLRRGTVAFSTLEGRPSAFQFDTNPALQVIPLLDNFDWAKKYEKVEKLNFSNDLI